MKADKPSATAYLIADSTVFLSKTTAARHLVSPRAAELSAWLAQTRSWFARRLFSAMSTGCLRPLSAALERLTVPGIQLHYALRKRYLEDAARAALSEGFSQLVVFGAGFDTLTLRLHEVFPAAQFIEIDHPATQKIKTRVVAERNLLKRNLRFVPLDITHQDFDETLLSFDCYRPHEKTLFIAEGVLMYLAPDAVDRLLFFVRHHSGIGSRFAFTFMETRRDGRVAFRRSSRAVSAWLRLRGEPFKWGMRRAQTAEYLAVRGFRIRELVIAETFRRQYLAQNNLAHLPLAEGECICVADCA